MAHLQQQILEAVQSVLKTGSPTAAGQHVYLDRIDDLDGSLCPAITIAEAGDGEDVQIVNFGGTLQQRTLRVQIECCVKVVTTFAADARSLGLAVEKLLNAATRPAGLSALINGGDIAITASRQDMTDSLDKPVAKRVQTWQITYFCDAATPDAAA